MQHPAAQPTMQWAILRQPTVFAHPHKAQLQRAALESLLCAGVYPSDNSAQVSEASDQNRFLSRVKK
jgi:hypothetical protein